MNHSILRPILLAFFLFWGSFALLSPVQAADFDHLESEYLFYLNGFETSTENKLVISHVDNLYTVDFSLDHWMASAVNRGTFEWQDCQAKPISRYFHARSLGIDKIEDIQYDYENEIIHYADEDEKQTFSLEEGIMDSMTFFMVSRCDMMAGKREFTYDILFQGKIRQLKFNLIRQETIETPYGKFHALRIERDHGKSKRQSVFWVAPELDYHIVKVFHRENALIEGTAVLKKHKHSVLRPPARNAVSQR